MLSCMDVNLDMLSRLDKGIGLFSGWLHGSHPLSSKLAQCPDRASAPLIPGPEGASHAYCQEILESQESSQRKQKIGAAGDAHLSN